MRCGRGFSLIEMAVVLIIIGLLLGGMLMPLSTQVENTQRRETESVMAEFHDLLIGFALVNGRLPCPDTNNDGLENQLGGAGACVSASGVLPWVTLGSAESDAWGNRFTYHVSASFADNIVAGTVTPPAGCTAIPTQASFSLCSEGNIRVRDAVGGNLVADKVPAVVVSHGRNGLNVASNDETENTDADGDYVAKVYSSVAGSEYDDIVIWVPTNMLLSRMVSANKLP